MGRSMSPVDLDREPPDGSFDHLPSKRRYQVQRRGGRMWHRELLLPEEGEEELVVSEFPVKYVTGSGRHSLTYLVETDGFMVESPITWYAAKAAWGMSPGYDHAEHQGFQREVGESCLICHAGRAEAVDGSLHRMRITEAAIGCERCHGPGSLHVARWSDGGALAGQPIDYSIVNPAHLSRELAEAVCQQCHLSASATVFARGRTASDFRPGLPLQDFRHDYVLDAPNEQMKVVGHVEQMHLSRCYQASAEFTCTTCHSPHGEPPPEEKTEYYRSVCLKCHQEQQCTADPQQRAAESNDCRQCHMPTSPTDIPHLAFTHHRVGIHGPAGDKQEDSSAPASVLKPFLDLSKFSAIDLQRSLGLAYTDLAKDAVDPEQRRRYQLLSLDSLSAVDDAGLPDGETAATLASLRFDLELPDVMRHAEKALADPRLPTKDRCNSLFLAADALFRERRYQEALLILGSLEQMRRHSVQTLLKAQCEQALEHFDGMEDALLQAVYINPRATHVHKFLAERFRKRGDIERAKRHERLAQE
jgi:predicted CXXCH cytochrome family protein